MYTFAFALGSTNHIIARLDHGSTGKIIEAIESESDPLGALPDDEDELEFEEGTVLYRTHRARLPYA